MDSNDRNEFEICIGSVSVYLQSVSKITNSNGSLTMVMMTLVILNTPIESPTHENTSITSHILFTFRELVFGIWFRWMVIRGVKMENSTAKYKLYLLEYLNELKFSLDKRASSNRAFFLLSNCLARPVSCGNRFYAR